MLTPLFEQNKNFLEKRNSYMLPRLDRIIYLLKKHEKNAGPDYFNAFKRIQLRKGEFLLQEGSVSKYLWFLESGIARIFNHKDGSELTQYIFTPAELIDARSSRLMQVPSEWNIQAIKDSVVIRINYHTWDNLEKHYPAIDEVQQLLFEDYFMWVDKRMVFHHGGSFEKYVYVLHELSPIINEITNTILASYIGVIIETVSRARRNIGCKGH